MCAHRRFLRDNFKSADGLISAIAKYGLDAPSKASVEKWLQRDSIPGEWLPVLLVILELEHGEPVRISQYMDGGQQ